MSAAAALAPLSHASCRGGEMAAVADELRRVANRVVAGHCTYVTAVSAMRRAAAEIERWADQDAFGGVGAEVRR